jgi:hypothetical protein
MPIISDSFKGKFFRNIEYVQELLESKVSLSDAQRDIAMEKTKMGDEFELFVTDFDPKTGLFTAKTKDIYGEAKAIGVTRDNETEGRGVIKFLKVYVSEHGYVLRSDTIIDDNNLRIFEYCGFLGYFDGRLLASGSYKNIREHERTGGKWDMESTGRVIRFS